MVALGWAAILCHASTLASRVDCLQSGPGKRGREEGERGKEKEMQKERGKWRGRERRGEGREREEIKGDDDCIQ